MQKIILPLLAILILGGCSQSTNSGSMVNESAQTSAYNESEIYNRINELKDGKKPMEKPNKETKPSAQSNTNEIKLDNLALEYSQVIIKTNFGNITVKFYAQESPLTVNNFLNLARDGFYNGTRFHRVIDDFMIQGGDPLSKDASQKNFWGTGGPGYQFQDEINEHKLVKGSLAMANSGVNTNGSQFFIVTKESTPWLDGKHTNFGYVSEGMEIVEKIEKVQTDGNDQPLEDVIIDEIELLK